jgi:hypothetical protein
LFIGEPSERQAILHVAKADALYFVGVFAELRTWCAQNRNRYYVPEWLLEEWSITVDPTFSAAA